MNGLTQDRSPLCQYPASDQNQLVSFRESQTILVSCWVYDSNNYQILRWILTSNSRVVLIGYDMIRKCTQKLMSELANRNLLHLARNRIHLPFNGPWFGITRVSWCQKGKTSLDLLEQETLSGSGTSSWAICKSAPRPKQITMPAPHHSLFTGRCHSYHPTNSEAELLQPFYGPLDFVQDHLGEPVPER